MVFAWQFPHFLAIAWLYREDYRRAGMKHAARALPGSEGIIGRQALAYGLLLLPVSLLPSARGDAGLVYTAAALVLGLGLRRRCRRLRLATRPERARASLLLVSLDRTSP